MNRYLHGFILNRLIYPLASMKTALCLLLLLGLVSTIGTWIPQGEAPGFYLSAYGDWRGKIILCLSFNQLFHSWWYLLLSGILISSLLACSFTRIARSKSRKWSSLAIHLGIVVVFAGACLSSLYAVKDNVDLGVGEKLSLHKYGAEHLRLSITDFKIEYYNNGQPRQYVTRFQINNLQTGQKKNGQVSVNHPYLLNGVKIYQSSYGMKAYGAIYKDKRLIRSFQNEDGDTIGLPDDIVLKTWLEGDGHHPPESLLGWAAIIPGQEVQLGYLKRGESAQVAGYRLVFHEAHYYTGLIIKKDPGIPFIFAGFLVTTLGFAGKYLRLKVNPAV